MRTPPLVTPEKMMRAQTAAVVRFATWLGVNVRPNDNKWQIACRIARTLKQRPKD